MCGKIIGVVSLELLRLFKMVSTYVFRRYILGCFLLENKVSLPQENTQPLKVPSTNIQYHFETTTSLKGIIELEFGFRKSFPVVVADLCKDLVKNNGVCTQSMLWIGAGTGRGPMLMSSVFDEVGFLNIFAVLVGR